MPGEDGISIAKKIRARGRKWSNVPILAMTAKVMAESVESYRAAGMNGIVPKPIIFDQLEHVLSEVGVRKLPEKLARMRSAYRRGALSRHSAGKLARESGK